MYNTADININKLIVVVRLKFRRKHVRKSYCLPNNVYQSKAKDRDYEIFIRKTKDELSHWKKPVEEEKARPPLLRRPRESLPPPFVVDQVYSEAEITAPRIFINSTCSTCTAYNDFFSGPVCVS